MAQIDFDPDNYVDEISTRKLVAELRRRSKERLDEVHDLDDLSGRICNCLNKGTSTEAFRLLADILSDLSPVDERRQREKYALALKTRDPVTNQPVIQ